MAFINRKFTREILSALILVAVISSVCAITVDQAQDGHEEEPKIVDEDITSNAIDEHNIKVTENRMAAQLFALLEHYKQGDPVGLPGAPIQDPMSVPDMKKSVGMGTLNMQRVQTHGLSKFRIKSVKANLQKMVAEAIIQLDEMLIQGQYTLNSFFSKSTGPFKVVLHDVLVKGTAMLGVDLEGKLSTTNIKMDITFKNMTMDFQNLGLMGTVFQSIMNSAPNLVFEAMKPFMLQEADKQIRSEVNTNIEKLMGDRRLPISIAPLDMAISELRKKVRSFGFDPYRMPDYNRTVGIFTMQLANTWIAGLSSFHRTGEMIVSMENNTIHLRSQIGTQELSGAGQWEVGCGLVTSIGHLQFTVQHLRATLEVSQALDTRQRPQIKDLQLELGNIQVRCDGAGTLDYVLEFVVNVLPNLLRYQIMDALENPIKMRVQEKLNMIDVEQAIRDNAGQFEKIGKDFSFDFKL